MPGKEHPSTLNNLAAALRDQGKDEEAEEIYRHGLRLSEDLKIKPNIVVFLQTAPWQYHEDGELHSTESVKAYVRPTN